MSIEEMTHDDIIRMAKEAGFKPRHNAPREWWMLTEDIEHFAALVAAAEREACAKVCEECGAIVDGLNPLDGAEAIRKRGKE